MEARRLNDGLAVYSFLPYGSGFDVRVDPSVICCHPDRLAGSIRFPTRLRRVLDIACGSGKQILVSALLNPDVDFHGVDGTPEHIDDARRYARRLNLKNVTFECADLRDWRPPANAFDLITCSGTFSWVPPDVQRAILHALSVGLAIDGIASLHLLTMPGSGAMIEARKVVVNVTREQIDATSKLAAVRAHVATLTPPADDEDDSKQGTQVRRILRRFLDEEDYSVVHEMLSADISAFFFREIGELASRFGLHVVGDSDFTLSRPTWLPPGPVATMYLASTSWDERQELIDMFGGRGGARGALISRSPRTAGTAVFSFDGLHVRLRRWVPARRKQDVVAIAPDVEETLSSTALAVLDALEKSFPESVLVDELPHEDRDRVMLRFVELGFVSVASTSQTCISWSSGYPMLFDFTRTEIEFSSRALTTRTGESLTAHPAAVAALSLCDGTRSISELRSLIVSQALLPPSQLDKESGGGKRWWLDCDSPKISNICTDEEAKRLLEVAHEYGFFE